MPNLPLTENPNPDRPPSVDLAIIARDLRISPENVEKTVQLLDDGNTIPFITRFRKDLTGGLNEKQILSIKQLVAQHRALAERKTFILKSVDSQGKLTDELKQEIHVASSSRRLEDLYLPFKPQKQSRASAAKQQGLEPLADDIFSATTTDVDLAARATDFVRVDKGLHTVDDVIRGVSDLLVERFGENGDLRSSLRQIVWNTGKLGSHVIGDPEQSSGTDAKPEIHKAAIPKKEATVEPVEAKQTDSTDPNPTESASDLQPSNDSPATDSATKETTSEPAVIDVSASSTAATENVPDSIGEKTETSDAETPASDPAEVVSDEAITAVSNEAADAAKAGSPSNAATEAVLEDTGKTAPVTEATAPSDVVKAAPKKKKKKKKRKKATADPFKDYHDFKQPLKKLPNHRVLAINRGERAGKLKIRVQADDHQLTTAAFAALVPENHPFSEFLKKCAAEALSRVLFPSLEREVRRELTEAAEKHAVEVFANNLRNLLLQPPIRNCRVLAIDPGFKSGCGVAVLDTFGNLLDSGHVFVVGNQSRRDESKQKIVDWVNGQAIDIIAIGTGAACRQAEQLVSDTITEQFQDHRVRYVMINEAGASIYSTSEIGREELPDIAPSIRSAISIGRRLQDPLSELVKISPANIGVGMYQHDVKAKHLSESLDDVVEVCVNQVGVNVNTASPSLLKYVSGLNALTARRLVEHRQQINGFTDRQQLKEVSGIGDATFVQSAGFLRIRGGANPLDSTSIHPESYGIAENIIARVKSTPEELFPYSPDPIPIVTVAAAQSPAKTTATHDVSDNAEAVPSTDVIPEAEVAPQPDSVSTPVVNESTNEPVAVEPVAVEPDSAESASAEPALTAPPLTEPVKTTVNPAAASARECLTEDQAILHAEARKEVIDQITKLEIDQIAEDNSAGKLLVRDILMALRKPDWDPRDRVHKPIFRRGIIKVDDLKPEMQLDGQIVNVVDFGVFVDIGLGESSLVHVSQLSNQYVRDPHRFCAVGDILKVWVSEIDSERRRVKLTAIQPGTKVDRTSKRTRTRGPRKKPDEQATSSTPQKAGGTAESRVKRFERSKTGQRPARDGQSRNRRDGNRSNSRYEKPKTHRPSQPAPPITDGMLKGDEPMRSFSDLIQFVQKKPAKDDKKSS